MIWLFCETWLQIYLSPLFQCFRFLKVLSLCGFHLVSMWPFKIWPLLCVPWGFGCHTPNFRKITSTLFVCLSSVFLLPVSLWDLLFMFCLVFVSPNSFIDFLFQKLQITVKILQSLVEIIIILHVLYILQCHVLFCYRNGTIILQYCEYHTVLCCDSNHIINWFIIISKFKLMK